MSVCKGCYRQNVDDYCLRCRKQLFGGVNVKAVLSFDSPSAGGKALVFNNINKISISGAQIKFSVLQDKKELKLTTKGATHLLKPKPYGPFQNPAEAPANEHLTMQLAAQLFKIPTAANGLIYFNGQEEFAYITRRFDVLPDGTKNLQEDFAQLAGRTEENAGKNYKYNSSYEEIANLMKRYVGAYKPMAEQFFKIVVFNYLFSNGDAHLKNFSLVRTRDGDYVLSPAYDLMTTALHTPGERDLALENGLYEGDYKSPGFDAFGFYTRMEFQTFAERIGVVPKRAKSILDLYLNQYEAVKSVVAQSFLGLDTRAEYLRLLEGKIRCMKQSDIL